MNNTEMTELTGNSGNNGISRYEIIENLHKSRRTLVYRGHRLANREKVILKILKPDAATEDELARFRREFSISSKISFPGIVKIFGLEEYNGSLITVMADIGGKSLDHFQLPLPMLQFLELSIALADTIESMHKRQVIHKNINPSNIIWNPQTKQLNLIDFGIADEVPKRTVSPQAPSSIDGTLEYISPEQTGRMNRVVDYRTDFYSLGVTFYQLLTGQLPFVSPDALGIVHLQIAGTVQSPHELKSDIPEMISRIVMKLMAKMADERYQNAWGLRADLERCLKELQREGTVKLFDLGKEDFSDQLRAPQKLYGRQRQTEQLLDSFERVSAGERELFLVAGYSGIGKTALVHEVHRPIAEKKGFFIEGKFEQLQRNVPYYAWIHAFAGFTDYLLMESEADVAHWRASILDAVGSIGKVVTDVIPDLELIIGSQPDIPALGPVEAQNRFNYVFVKFVKGIATREHPLVVFLDDLQWIDTASLNLLQTLMSTVGMAHILIIGAYRKNEVDALHQLTKTIEPLRREQAPVRLLTLEDLSEETVNEMIADTLHVEHSQTIPLTHLIYAKTGGNPFFILQTLGSLAESRLISFDAGSRRWEWDISALRSMEITDNVVSLMLGKIRNLPLATQQILPLAACVGFRFSLSNLRIIARQDENAVLEHLQPAMQEGLIVSLNGGYQFAHDRIQLAAYSLIPDADRKLMHLEIGRLLRVYMTERDLKEQVFTVVDHLNIGAELIVMEDERLETARLNLRAGLKARASAAFSAAAKYFEAGVGMLAENCWTTQYPLTLELYTRAAEAESLNGDYAGTDRLFSVITGNAKTAVDMAGACESRMNSYISQGKLQEALDTALDILERLGLYLPAYPSAKDIEQAMKETQALYTGIPIEELINLPKMTDPEKLAVMRIASKTNAVALSSRPDLHVLVLLSEVALSIRYGNSVESPFFYAAYALVLCGILGDYDTGYRFGNLALMLMKNIGTLAFESKVLGAIGGHIWHFKEHLRAGLPYSEKGYQSGLETGDLEFAAYNAHFFCFDAYFAGVELRGLEQVLDSYSEAVRRIRSEIGYYVLASYRQSVENLLSSSGNPCLFSGKSFNEEEMLPILEQTRNIAALAAFSVCKLMLCYLFGDYEQALKNAELAEKNQGGMLAMFPQAVAVFYDSLTRLRLYPDKDALEQARIIERVSMNQQQMKKLADSAPMNFLHKFFLVEAERMRLAGEDMAALDFYDKAISLAKKNEYVQEEALANELAARFWFDKSKEDFARIYLIRAHHSYHAWGAVRKVRDLEERYSTLQATWPEAVPARTPLERLDLSTVMKASQAVSSEIEMKELLNQVMHIVIENAGAQSGFLLMEKDGKWVVVAQSEIDRKEVEISHSISIEEGDIVSLGVVRFVARTQERVLLDDAANQGEFVSDPYIRHKRAKSLLCAALLSRGRLIGILYLENNLTTNAFTPERVQFLEMLLAQVATSLENARVYEALKESESKYRVLNQQLEQRVTDRTAQLEASNKELEAFSYSVSHDLRAPLRAIDGFSRALLSGYQDAIDEQGKNYLQRVCSAVQRMAQLIDDLLDLSRVTRDKMVMELVDLSAIAEEIADNLRKLEPGRRVEFIIQSGMTVRGDGGLLRIMLMNLFNNAWKFTSQHNTARIEFGARPEQGNQVYFIRDDGAGFDMKYAHTLFHAFQRLHNSKEFPGTGIGLATVQRIIRRHGGDVWAEGEIEKGATVYFTIS